MRINMKTEHLEQLVDEIQSLDRHAMTARLMELEGRFRMDFTREFLDACSVEHLRHILLAACMQMRRGKAS